MNTAELIKGLESLLWPNMGDANREIIEKAITALHQAENIKLSHDVWLEKTEWVQTDKRFDVLLPWGKHRGDVLREYIKRLEGDSGRGNKSRWYP